MIKGRYRVKRFLKNPPCQHLNVYWTGFWNGFGYCSACVNLYGKQPEDHEEHLELVEKWYQKRNIDFK